MPRTLGVAVLVCSWCVACSVKTQQRALTPPGEAATLDRQAAYLKAHLKNGDVLVLDPWSVDTATVRGQGTRLNANRSIVDSGALAIALDSVALFETNVLHKTTPTALTVITGISVGVTVFCLTNTKACFGSCPTFYASDGHGDLLQAEGFSASVAPALEATDVDALFRARPTGRDFTLRMTNEALETHVVRYVRVLAAARPPGGRVFATPAGVFRGATDLTAPSACRGAGDDCTRAVAAFDDVPRVSTSDSTDLAAKETVDLEFAVAPGGDLGLVLAARQSLVSTFLFYQGLAYLGRQAGTYLAALDRAGPLARSIAGGPGRLLGRIEVLVANDAGDWVAAGEMGETGPLATDVKIVPLPDAGGRSVRVRLRMARGAWRIDWVALARLGAVVEPRRLAPRTVWGNHLDTATVQAWLGDTTRALVAEPGDEVRLTFQLPGADHELFLETRGYYLEWMRQEWLAEENAGRAAEMFFDPAGALRRLAPEYARRAGDLERAFWSSRYGRR